VYLKARFLWASRLEFRSTWIRTGTRAPDVKRGESNQLSSRRHVDLDRSDQQIGKAVELPADVRANPV